MNQFAKLNAQSNIDAIKSQMMELASDTFEVTQQIEDLQRRMAECPATSDRQVAWLKWAERQLSALQSTVRKHDRTLEGMQMQSAWHQNKIDRLTPIETVVQHEPLGPEKLGKAKSKGDRKGRSEKSLKDQQIRSAMKGGSSGSSKGKRGKAA